MSKLTLSQRMALANMVGIWAASVLDKDAIPCMLVSVTKEGGVHSCSATEDVIPAANMAIVAEEVLRMFREQAGKPK